MYALYILMAILMITIVILAHELGHFWAAKRVKIEVREFSLGFGPKIWSSGGDKKPPDPVTGMVQTEYAWRLIPFGASVRMTGEEIDDEPGPYSYTTKSPWQKILVASAGPLMNLILGALIFVLIYTFFGVAEPLNTPVIGTVGTETPAAAAGIKPGDRVLKVNGQPINTWDQMVAIVRSTKTGEAVHLVIERNGQIKNISVTPEWEPIEGVNLIGVAPQYKIVRVGVLEANKQGFINTYIWTVRILKGLGLAVSGQVKADDMGGPVLITKLMGDAASSGLAEFLGLTAIISINLGIFNLLPFPALDGSRVVFALVEAIRRRPVEPEKENMIHFVGFALLMVLITLVTFNDIIRLIRGG